MSKITTQTYKDPRAAERFWQKEQNPAAERNASVWQFMNALTLEDKIVLDVGCGFGRDVGEMRKRGAQAYGLDVSAGLLKRAQESYGDWFAECDFYKLKELPFGLEYVDGFWSVATLVHVASQDISGILKQWDSWLRPGGFIAAITKHGEGHETFYNLGEDLPREMFYHQPETLTAALPHYKVMHQVTWQPTVVAEAYFGLILQKPIA